MKKLVIFDLDGLLIDTERMYHETWKRTFSDENLHMPEDLLLSTAGKALKETKKVITDHFKDDDIFDVLRSKREIKFWQMAKDFGVPVKEGAQEVIDFLNNKNITMALASSTQTDRALKLIDLSNLKLSFKIMMFGDMVRETKPSPEIYNLVMSKLGYKVDETIILEDSYSGIKAANNANVDVLWIKDLIDQTDKKDIYYKKSFNSLHEVIPYLAKVIE